ncbi:MAG: PrpR N-terminal domain-containing protein [Deltaproteobacteria bacterium]|nr:MAG: PrpR N-terminal domain-containing protein [Deltaproteobacteria bacterium]
MERDGVEVIISRRGTAHLLRENLRIPVLSFPLTSLDLLKNLKEAAKYSRKILLTTFRSKLSGIEIVKDLLGIQLTQDVYYDAASMKQAVLVSHSKGCEVTVGGNIIARYAREAGLNFVEIRTSAEEVVATIENAKFVAPANRD